MKITIVGTGYVGLVTGACFAEIGHEVLCVDNDERKIKMLKAGKMPIYEPGLEELVAPQRRRRPPRFTTSIEEGTDFAEVIFIAVGTPPGYQGEANLSYVEQVGRKVAEHMTAYRLLVEKSTVPVNTAEQLKRTVAKYSRADVAFDVASNPEFLREGTAIEDALKPDRIVVGVESERAGEAAARDLRADHPEERRRVPADEHRQRGADQARLQFLPGHEDLLHQRRQPHLRAGRRGRRAGGARHGAGPRIGPRFLKAGVGYGGSCFPKDVDAFVHLADQLGYDFELLKEVQRINEAQREHVMQKIQHELWVIQDKTVAVLGLAFKPGTDDMREARLALLRPPAPRGRGAAPALGPRGQEKFKELHPDLAYFTDRWNARGTRTCC